MIKTITVAAAILQKQDQQILLGQRGTDTFFADYWEFPGGKQEVGESLFETLKRELKEELAIDIQQAYPWVVRVHDYPHAKVHLHFFRVLEWQGALQAKVHQQLAWQNVDQVQVSPLLPANATILKFMKLSSIMGITDCNRYGIEEQLQRLDLALQKGLKLVQIREKNMPLSALNSFIHAVIEKCKPHGARVLINQSPECVHTWGKDVGCHLTSVQLAKLTSRPDYQWVGASCHDRQQLDKAIALGLDYALVGAVLPTASHPGQSSLGWEEFTRLIHGAAIPIYALGGMAPIHIEQAWQCGAHGIAAIRGCWS